MSTFGRVIEVTVGGKLFASPPLTIEFDLPFSESSAANVGEVKIYNLAEKTVKTLEVDAPVVVQAGYEGDVGTVAVGTASEVSTSWVGVDKVTTIVVGDGAAKWLSARVNRSWRQGVRASHVARDIIDLLGLRLGRLQLPYDVQYPTGKAFSTSAKAALEEIAADTGAKLHVTREAIYLVPPGDWQRIGVYLSAETGLIESPQPSSQKPGAYRIRTLLQHRITTDTMVEIESRTARGQYRVAEGRHKSSLQEHVTEALVVPV